MTQREVDFEMARREGAEQETRCYTITGATSVLDRVEEVLRCIEWVGEHDVTRLVSAYVEGARGAKIVARAVASWPADEGEENGEGAGAKLRALYHEETMCGTYLVGVVVRG